MKFKNFDVADVFGPNDIEQAKHYIGKKGYYTDHLERLDDFIENNRHIGTLHSITSKDTFERLIVGCEFDYPCPYTYFLPLEKVKKEYTCNFNTSPLDDVKYRACKDIRDVMKLLDKEEHGNNLVGTIIHIRHKITETTETAMITNVQRRRDGEYHLIFGNAGYTLNDLFDCIDILINGKYQPFGVEVKDD